MEELINIIPNWVSKINKGSKLAPCSLNVIVADLLTPSIQIESLDVNIVRGVIEETVVSICDLDREFSSLWLEKFRRYCEINRPNLKEISLRRFGKDDVQKNLEYMTLVLSVGTYCTKKILLFNALATIVDFLSSSPFSKKWCHYEIKEIAEAVLSKPDSYIGNRHD